MKWMENELESLTELALERTLRPSSPVPGRPGWVNRGGRALLNLSGNDYLGLSQHPAIAEAMRDALEAGGGSGAGASRLVTGNRPQYGLLEQALSKWQQSEAALVFASGYAANCGAISALVSRGDVVFSDRLNHASIVDGIILSRAGHARYRHKDMEHLQWLLGKHREARRKLIVTDAVFSMDGDAAPLGELAALKREYGAMLMVDEAHSGGLYGPCGEGISHALGVHRDVDVHVGTFSKAFGVYGAYVSGSSTLIRWLTNKARPLIYSTALPPHVVAGILRALELVQSEHEGRKRLAAASARFRSALAAAGFLVSGEPSSATASLRSIGDGPSPMTELRSLSDGSSPATASSRSLSDRPLSATASFLAANGGMPLSEAASTSFKGELPAAEHRRCPAAGWSPIVPIIVGDNAAALRFSEALDETGIAAVAIRPPTVPDGTARIRFSLSAAHTGSELDEAAERICSIGRELGVTANE